MSHLIFPKIHVPHLDDALIFLAGPIQGAPLWQDDAIAFIRKKDPSIYIASPHRRVKRSNLRGSMDGPDDVFSRQTLWERHYLDIAARTGAILFWLPCQKFPRLDGAYSRDTRGELGEWRGTYKVDKRVRYVIGAEEDFDGLSVIKANELAVEPQRVFYTTLEQTCDAAVALARQV